MPAAPRPSNKATKIAYKVVGIPPNLQAEKKSKRDKKVNERLIANETRLVR